MQGPPRMDRRLWIKIVKRHLIGVGMHGFVQASSEKKYPP